MTRKTYEPSKLEDPPPDFCEWWNPFRRDNESGADIGGHPDAERVWSRKDPGRWIHRTYGTNARVAWNTQCYRNEFFQWINLGRPERDECRMIAATMEHQRNFWRELKTLLSQIGKSTTNPKPFDYDKPSTRSAPQY